MVRSGLSTFTIPLATARPEPRDRARAARAARAPWASPRLDSTRLDSSRVESSRGSRVDSARLGSTRLDSDSTRLDSDSDSTRLDFDLIRVDSTRLDDGCLLATLARRCSPSAERAKTSVPLQSTSRCPCATSRPLAVDAAKRSARHAACVSVTARCCGTDPDPDVVTRHLE